MKLTFSVLRIFLLEGKSLFLFSQKKTGRKTVKFSIVNKETFNLCLDFFKNDYGTTLGSFDQFPLAFDFS